MDVVVRRVTGQRKGWSVSPDELKLRFEQTQGRDPIFRTNDGSNCDHNIDVSTIEGRRKAYSLLLNKGLIRVALAPAETAEFDVVNVVNPYGCSDASTLSMYRRSVAFHQPAILEHSDVGWTRVLAADGNAEDYFQHEPR